MKTYQANFIATLLILLPNHNKIINNPSSTGSTFKIHFAKVTKNIQSCIRFFKRKYFDYLSILDLESVFITSTDSIEVLNIISSINQDSSDTPKILTKNLKLLNKDILDELAVPLNQIFSSEKIPSLLETKKDNTNIHKVCKLGLLCYKKNYLFSTLNKFLVNIMYNKLNGFLKINGLIFSLHFALWKHTYPFSWILLCNIL